MPRTLETVISAEGLQPKLLFLHACTTRSTQSRVEVLQQLYPMAVVLVLLIELAGALIIQLLEVVEHDGHSEVEQEVAADDDDHHEETGGEEDAVAVLHHVHHVGPAFEGRALENSQVAV